MLRKTGFYSVKRRGCWEVALYMLCDKAWQIVGFAGNYEDTEFEEIKDSPIKLPV